MKRSTYKKMKETGWESFVEWAIAHDIMPNHLTDENKLTFIKNHLAVLKLMADMEKQMFSSSVVDMKPGQAIQSFMEMLKDV